jgi:hypothetical protein
MFSEPSTTSNELGFHPRYEVTALEPKGNAIGNYMLILDCLIENILHDCGDDDCVKILQHCKEAIPARNEGGKVIIIEMMRGSGKRK